MSRLKVLFALSTAIVAVTSSSWLWDSEANAFGRRRWTCCQPCCVQYVYVGDQRPSVDPNSHKVHWLSILETEDLNIADAVLKEHQRVEDLFLRLPKEYRGDFDEVRGKDLTRDEVLRKIRELRVGPNETLVVYCNLHGEPAGTSQEKGSKEGSNKKEEAKLGQDAKSEATASSQATDLGLQDLRMYDGAPEGQRTLARTDLMEAIERTGARLKILLTDSCFGVEVEEDKAFFPVEKLHRAEPGKPPKSPPGQYTPPARTGDERLVMIDLFVNHRGVLNVNSAKEKELAVANIFCPVFADLIYGSTIKKEWKDFFKDLKGAVAKKFEITYQGSKEAPAWQRIPNKTQTVFNFLRDESGNDLFPEYAPVSSEQESQTRANESQATSAESTEERISAISGTAPPTAAPATLIVNLPADAQLFVEGVATQQTSARRVFQTPELPVDREYSYTLQAELSMGERTITETRTATVRAGHETEVNFRRLATVARATGTPAEIVVRLPAAAKLYVDGELNPESGDERLIQTPPLTRGKDYVLNLEVRSSGTGATDAQQRRIVVTAGERQTVDFTRSDQTVAR